MFIPCHKIFDPSGGIKQRRAKIKCLLQPFLPNWRERMELENTPWVSCLSSSEIFPNSLVRDTGEKNLWFFPILTRTYWPGKHPVQSVGWGKEKVYSAIISPKDLTDSSFKAVNLSGLRHGSCATPSGVSRGFNVAGGLVLNGFSNSESW